MSKFREFIAEETDVLLLNALTATTKQSTDRLNTKVGRLTDELAKAKVAQAEQRDRLQALVNRKQSLHDEIMAPARQALDAANSQGQPGGTPSPAQSEPPIIHQQQQASLAVDLGNPDATGEQTQPVVTDSLDPLKR